MSKQVIVVTFEDPYSFARVLAKVKELFSGDEHAKVYGAVNAAADEILTVVEAPAIEEEADD